MSQPVRLWVKSLAPPLAIAASHPSLAAAPGGTAYVPPPLSAYGQLPSLADPAVSPAGDRLACIERRHGKRYIVVFDLPAARGPEFRGLSTATLSRNPIVKNL